MYHHSHKPMFICLLLFISILVRSTYSCCHCDKLDDLEHGTNQNLFGDYWYFFSDAQAPNNGTSQITNATIDSSSGMLLFDGGYTPGYNSNYSARMDFLLGEPFSDSAGISTFDPWVGMGTNLVPDDQVLDITDITTISFFAKASTEMTVRFNLETAGVTDGDYYGKDLTIGTEWEEYSIMISGGDGGSGELEQQHWGDDVAYDPANAQRISFIASGLNDPDLDEGWLLVDDIYLRCCSSRTGGVQSFDPLPDVPPGAIFSDFESGANSTAGFPWYGFTDSEKSGTSSITSGVDEHNEIEITEEGRIGLGAHIEFTMGSRFTHSGYRQNPYAGIETSFFDTTGLTWYNAAADGASGIYLEYKTCTNVDMVTVEVYDHEAYTGLRGEGVVHYILLPPTDTEWAAVKLPLQCFMLPAWGDSLSDAALDIERLMKLRIKVEAQEDEEGSLTIDNVNFIGSEGDFPVSVNRKPVGKNANNPLIVKHLEGRLSVSWETPVPVYEGTMTVINARGAVVKNTPLTLRSSELGASASISYLNLPQGLYFLNLQARDKTGKSISASRKFNLVR
ncbi:carbohydrate binding domain-containing protein [Chitinispirillales bacterium ANBcel5]|uniref:hypothetical protein n=1 Tax=Cellulosispirillum alkaliphilum TaxID=3039283 RepID=UPI002A4FD410|nr:carbohydrate binding domain-containing protein [Chitinispirillales bacterium ANBcel5]